ncbi:hypothetical protein GJ744_005861 [Endocarpon pusillum]|uniref:Uncharacterized protein n=1 Tax=Endocarpon pusillum TaxID=364733 RepID=A0A8H7A4C2_9EURO|nr:hypothetical protein GJ744_005861 [Endocarpon pusillum]
MAGLMQREQLGQSDRKLLGGICRGATRAGLGYNGWAFPIHPIQEVLSHWPEDRQLIPRAVHHANHISFFRRPKDLDPLF